MKTMIPVSIRQIIFIFLALFMAACAKPYHLNVAYDIPVKSNSLPKNSIAIKVIDLRESSAIFSERAKKEFDRWDGTFVLLDSETTPDSAEKTNNLPDLFKIALKKRLETMNIHVVDNRSNSLPILEVTLEKFLLELKDRTWVSDLSYEAKLSKDGSKTGKERINAQAERTKVMGKAGGERLIGEIFTEGINKLNLQKLFENAGF
jgi:hypothetical protein